MNAQIPTRTQSRRGIALVLVVLVMALAGVLAFAMLTASAVQATAGSNAVAAAVARAQAESGIHLAMYYLLNPANAPSAPPCTWSNVTFSTVAPAATIPGSVTIQVGALANHCYQVIATGSSDSSSGVGAVTHKITAEVQVGMPLPINEGGAFNGNFAVGAGSSFTSATAGAPAIASSGAVTNNGTVSGNISAASLGGTGTQTNGSMIAAPAMSPAPSSSANVTNYSQYLYQGVLYNGQLVTSPISSATSLAPNPISNPLGVFYTSGNLVVNNTLSVNGTLIVNGALTDTKSATITPVASSMTTNMPALIVSGHITMNGSNRTLNATGVVYSGQGINGISAGSHVTINGALLVTSGGVTGYTGAVAVTYNPSYTNIPNFDTADWDNAAGVKIISWSE